MEWVLGVVIAAIVGLITYSSYKSLLEDRALFQKWGEARGLDYQAKNQDLPSELQGFQFVRRKGRKFSDYVSDEDSLKLSGRVESDGWVSQMVSSPDAMAFEYMWVLDKGINSDSKTYTRLVVAMRINGAPADLSVRLDGELMVESGEISPALRSVITRNNPKNFEWLGEWMVVSEVSSLPVRALDRMYPVIIEIRREAQKEFGRPLSELESNQEAASGHVFLGAELERVELEEGNP